MRVVLALVAVGPLLASAAPPRNFGGVVEIFLGYIRLLIPLVIGLTFIILAWGVVRAWIIGQGNTEKIQAGQQIALWGVIGLVVMIAVWGIVAMLRTSFFGL